MCSSQSWPKVCSWMRINLLYIGQWRKPSITMSTGKVFCPIIDYSVCEAYGLIIVIRWKLPVCMLTLSSSMVLSAITQQSNYRFKTSILIGLQYPLTRQKPFWDKGPTWAIAPPLWNAIHMATVCGVEMLTKTRVPLPDLSFCFHYVGLLSPHIYRGLATLPGSCRLIVWYTGLSVRTSVCQVLLMSIPCNTMSLHMNDSSYGCD